jgi:hypothetical protein
MKLIPPQNIEIDKTVELAGVAHVLTKPVKAPEIVKPLSDKKARVRALTHLRMAVDGFSDSLGNALGIIEQNTANGEALFVTGLLVGMAEALRNVSTIGGENGHTGSRSATSASDGILTGSAAGTIAGGKKKRGRPRKNPLAIAGATATAAPSGKRRGRPKGSKNKATIERERAERAAKRDAKRKPVAAVKRPAKRKPVVTSPIRERIAKRAAGRKPAAKNTARKGGQAGGRKVARKAASKKR